ncbi:MAG: ribosomal protein L7/L12 [Clostridia bacterium]|nr:ribosomal protein L7/L12 [Clostridia bacterium]
MALIKCPECGKEISDKSPACIHCGFPLDTTTTKEEPTNANIVKIGGVDYDLTEVIELINKNEKIKAIKILREKTGLGLADAKDVADNLEQKTNPTTGFTPKYSTVSADIKATLITCKACGKQISNQAPTCIHCGQPTGIQLCPKCGSSNTKVISGASKAVSIGLWGIFAANKVMSKYECKKCGHKF